MKKLLFFLFVALFAPNLFGQSDVQTQSGVRNPQTMEEVRNEDFQRRRAALSRAMSIRPELSTPRNKRLTSEERRRVKIATKVSKEVKNQYRNFLKQSNTGIFRLFPDFGCETKNVIRVDGDCKDFIPGRWAYSFRLKSYSNKTFHDISFKKDKFIVKSLLTQGILVDLGDSSIDDISLDQKSLEYLVNFVPANDRKKASEQYKELSVGVEKNGFKYSNNLTVKEDTTYALRLIAYKYKDEYSTRLWQKNIGKATDEERKFFGIQYDKRNDSIFLFRIVKKSDDDAGITIIWKRLSKKKSPKLIYEKAEKLKGFKSLKDK